MTYPDCYSSYGTTHSLKTGNSFNVSANNRWSPLIYSEQMFKCNFYYNDPFPSFAEFCVEKSSVETRIRKPFSSNTMLIRTCVLPPCDEAWRAQILLNYSVFIWGLIVSVCLCMMQTPRHAVGNVSYGSNLLPSTIADCSVHQILEFLAVFRPSLVCVTHPALQKWMQFVALDLNEQTKPTNPQTLNWVSLRDVRWLSLWSLLVKSIS